MNLKHLVYTTTGLALIISLVSCQSKETSTQNNVPEVATIKVQQQHGLSTSTYAATIEGTRNIEIRPQTSGYLSKIHVDEGAYVQKGQSLFQIDDRPYTEQYNTAKAAVSVAEATIKNLKIDLDRKVELAEKNIVSDLQVSQATVSLEGARASLEQARAAMNAAKINLDFCLVKAPVSGYIGRILFRIGSLVNASSVEPLTLLTDIDHVYSYFSMSEADFVNYQEKKKENKGIDSVSLILSNGTTYEQTGVIDAITGQFDKNTASISIRAIFNNPEKKLRAGNTGRIQMTQILNDVLIVPIKATVAIQDKIFVYKVDKDSKVKQSLIKVSGKTTENYYVSEGLSNEDIIITAGLGMLRDGMLVKAKN
ncbi:MAG: efflux RND transporter periplasmic adaptor subunit [Sphingobacterium sp.]|jgi:membrane fusion protein (multidrug efflux system)|nr:efflux RND transporter periplasmic adaptor subunit [Sphingobacterium sp.]